MQRSASQTGNDAPSFREKMKYPFLYVKVAAILPQITRISVFKKRLVSGDDCTTAGCIALDCMQHMKFVPHKTVHAS
jgi:hypothetical protein